MAALELGDPLLRRELRGVPLVAARVGAGGLAAFALLLFARGLPSALERATERARAAAGDAWLEPASLVVTWIGITSALVWCALAGLILWRRSRDPFGIFLAIGFVAIGLILASPEQIILFGESAHSHASDPWIEVGRAVIWILTGMSLVWVFAFPDGRLVPPWSWVFIVPWAAWALVRIPFPELSHTSFGVAGGLAYVAFPISALAAQAYRFGWRSDPVQRQQLKWFMYGAVLIVAAWVTAVIGLSYVLRDVGGQSAFVYRTASTGWLAAMSMLIPVMIAIAIFRQGLLNIDVLINRTVMYGTLTLLLLASFVVVAALAQRVYVALAGHSSDLVAAAVAIPVALAFAPLRTRVQAIADDFLSARTILTLVFLDLAHSTEVVAERGDRAWRDLLERYRAAVRRELRQRGGREIDTAGDGFFVTFSSPAPAIRFARDALAAVRSVGLEARAGIHVGEVEVHGGYVTGLVVHIAARIVGAAEPGEVMVSRTVRDLLAGSNVRLVSRGHRSLKGLQGRWQLYSVVPSRPESDAKPLAEVVQAG